MNREWASSYPWCYAVNIHGNWWNDRNDIAQKFWACSHAILVSLSWNNLRTWSLRSCRLRADSSGSARRLSLTLVDGKEIFSVLTNTLQRDNTSYMHELTHLVWSGLSGWCKRMHSLGHVIVSLAVLREEYVIFIRWKRRWMIEET
jgi:hypothetical protein